MKSAGLSAVELVCRQLLSEFTLFSIYFVLVSTQNLTFRPIAFPDSYLYTKCSKLQTHCTAQQ